MEMRLDGPQIAVFMDFENVATSAEANYGDFDVTAVTDLLRSRGRLLIKRAYGDWGRFHRYRRPMLENGVDLLQLYSVGIQQKNRADVRLAIDAMEAVFTRPNIDVYAIVSGDSDFTELIHKLRDYGKYTIGIGLHSATSDLLRRACDEFIFYETLISEELADIADELHLPDPRELLRRALVAAEHKGESPVFAGRLKQIMLSLDSSFNEANYGYQQFRAFLEGHSNMITLQEVDMQLYAQLRKPGDPPALLQPPLVEVNAPAIIKPASDIDPGQRARSFLREAGLRVIDPATRQQVLADFLAALQEAPQPISLNQAADMLKDRYDAGNALTQKVAVQEIMRLLVMSDALRFEGGQPGSDAPLLDAGSLSLELLGPACDCVYVMRLVEGGVPIEAETLAPVLYGPGAAPERVTELCERLTAKGLMARTDAGCHIATNLIDRLLAREELATAAAGLNKVTLPGGEATVTLAESLFREASDLRQKDFAGSAQRYLQAARIQLDAVKAGQPRAGFDDLKWYLASYCSVKAGHAFVSGNYGEAVPFYLAFFGLAQESDCVWPRIQRLVNPMASYYFAIAGKRLNEPVPQNLGRSPAAQVALRIHNHSNLLVGQGWEELMGRLAAVNLGMVRMTFRELTGLAGPVTQVGDPARVERTRAFLADLIHHCQDAQLSAPVGGTVDTMTQRHEDGDRQ
jgi:uncharacterized protein (TIGR00288 family)